MILVALLLWFVWWANIGNTRYFAYIFYCDDQRPLVMGKTYNMFGTYYEYTYVQTPSWDPLEGLMMHKRFFCSEEEAEQAGYNRSYGIPPKAEETNF